MFPQSWRVASALFALLLFAACTDSAQSTVISCGPLGECPDGSVCRSGFCVPQGDQDLDESQPWTGECVEMFDCGLGYQCIDHFCIPDDLAEGGDSERETPHSDGDDVPGDGETLPDGDDELPPDGDFIEKETTEEDSTQGQPCVENRDCNDGAWCNGIETCGPNLRCVEGTSPCSDGIPCTDDRCDETTNECSYIANHGRCDDRDPCTGNEVCDDSGQYGDENGCVQGEPPTCDDEIGCTADSCIINSGCVHEPNDSQCENPAPECAAVECRSGQGCITILNDAACDDEVPCTLDVCDTVSGGCLNTPRDESCGDGINCTVDACTETGCVNTEDPEKCDDKIDCTLDACTAQGCTNTPDSGQCDDGFACTTDTCTAQGCVHDAVSASCNDGVACTVDTCEIGVGCRYTPNSALCVAPKLCDPILGCVDPPDCYTDPECSDGNVCNGAERCLSGRCTAGVTLDCNDGISCTVDTCDPTGGCLHTASPPLCNDDDPCTEDRCVVAQGGCTHTINKDNDRDTHIDAACTGGDDCNDEDAEIHPARTEICDDDKDNDCNQATDEMDIACAPCQGACASQGLACCNDVCVDTAYDNTHCGTCNNPCATACFKGVCLPDGKCARALRNLITDDYRVNDQDTDGLGNTFQGTCVSSPTGEDQIYAIKPKAGQPIAVGMYFTNFNDNTVEYEQLYLMNDCRDNYSCFESDASGTSPLFIILEDGNQGNIFFAVVDYQSGHDGAYDFAVDFDYSSSCETPGHGFSTGLLVLLLAGVLAARHLRRRKGES